MTSNKNFVILKFRTKGTDLKQSNGVRVLATDNLVSECRILLLAHAAQQLGRWLLLHSSHVRAPLLGAHGRTPAATDSHCVGHKDRTKICRPCVSPPYTRYTFSDWQ